MLTCRLITNNAAVADKVVHMVIFIRKLDEKSTTLLLLCFLLYEETSISSLGSEKSLAPVLASLRS